MIAAAVSAAVVIFSAGCQSQKPDAHAAPVAPVVSASATRTASNPTPAPARTWSGTLFGFRYDKSGKVYVYAVDGASRKLLASLPVDERGCVMGSVSVSLDGKRISYVTNGTERFDGDLFTGIIGGGPAKKIAAHVVCAGAGPVWDPDSSRLWVTRHQGEDAKDGFIDVSTGVFTAATIPVRRVWSPSGALQAYADATHEKITVAKADGTVVRTVRYKPDWAECEGWMPQTLSEDGRYLSVGQSACDPSRMLSAERVVDTTAGKEIPLPVSKIERVYFRTDGSMIVISGTIGYVIIDGVITAHQDLASQDLEIVRYRA